MYFKSFINLGQTVFRHTWAAPPTASTRQPPVVARPTRARGYCVLDVLRKKKKRSCTNDIGGTMGEGVEGEDEIQFLRTVSTFSSKPRVRVAQCGCGV